LQPQLPLAKKQCDSDNLAVAIVAFSILFPACSGDAIQAFGAYLFLHMDNTDCDPTLAQRRIFLGAASTSWMAGEAVANSTAFLLKK